MAREYFNAYHSYLENMKRLSDAEVGRLFRALLKYSMTGTLDDLPGNERFVIDGMIAQVNRDSKKYEEKCKLQQDKANKRWHATAYNGMPDDAEDAKEKEKEKEKTKKDLSIPDGIDCRTDVQRVVAAWNSLGLSKVERLIPDTERYKMLKCRLRDYGLEDVLKAIENVRTSDFLLGRAGNKPFLITFDWFVKPNNFPKVLDGNYNNNTNNGGNQNGLNTDHRRSQTSRWNLAAIDL